MKNPLYAYWDKIYSFTDCEEEKEFIISAIKFLAKRKMQKRLSFDMPIRFVRLRYFTQRLSRLNNPKKLVYISGAITGTTDYRRRFRKAQRMLERRGYKVFNPCCIPEVFKYDQYLQIDFAALDCCDMIYFIPHESTKRSNGAAQERSHAREKGIEVLEL